MEVRILLVVFTGMLLPWNGASAQNVRELLALAQPAVVKILVEGRDPNNITKVVPGSGFFVLSREADNLSIVITAAHVLGRPNEWLEDPNGQPVRDIWIERLDSDRILSRLPARATVLAEDHIHDVALLAIDGSGFPTLALGAPLDDLSIGERGLLVGYAANDSVATHRSGEVDRTEVQQFGLALRLNLVAALGQSGGPVLGPSGKVVGVASYNLPKDAPQYHIAALVSWVRPMLQPIIESGGHIPPSPAVTEEITDCDRLATSCNGSRLVYDVISLEDAEASEKSEVPFPSSYLRMRLAQELGTSSTRISHIRVSVAFIEPYESRRQAAGGTVIGYLLVSLPSLANCTRKLGPQVYSFSSANIGIMKAINEHSPAIADWLRRASLGERLTCPAN